MYYICKKRKKFDDVQYGVMDTKDGVVEYYSPKDIISFSRRGISINGVSFSDGKYTIKVLQPTRFEEIDSSVIVSEEVHSTSPTLTDKLCIYLENNMDLDKTFRYPFGVIKSVSDNLTWFRQHDLPSVLRMLKNINNIASDWESYTLCFRLGYDCEFYQNILRELELGSTQDRHGVVYITVDKVSESKASGRYNIVFKEFNASGNTLATINFKLFNITTLLDELHFRLTHEPTLRILDATNAWLQLYSMQGDDVVFGLMNDTMLRLTDLIFESTGVGIDVINACMLDGFDCVGFDNIDISHLFDGCTCSIYSAVEGTPRSISAESFGLDVMRGSDIRCHYDGSIDDFNSLKEWFTNLSI